MLYQSITPDMLSFHTYRASLLY